MKHVTKRNDQHYESGAVTGGGSVPSEEEKCQGGEDHNPDIIHKEKNLVSAPALGILLIHRRSIEGDDEVDVDGGIGVEGGVGGVGDLWDEEMSERGGVKSRLT